MKSTLDDTDLVEIIRKFETNRASGNCLYRVIKKTTESYGSEYVVRVAKAIFNSPQNFGMKVNRVMFARYSTLFLSKIYKATNDEKFLEYLNFLLTDNDIRIRQDAKKRLSKIKTKEASELLAEFGSL